MLIRNFFIASATSFALILAGFSATAEDDIPGVVIVDDEDAFENAIAFTSIGEGKTLGKLESAFACDLEDGDAECTLVTADTATGGVVVTMFQTHQINLLEHRGDTAGLKQKTLKMGVMVLDGTVSPTVLGATEGVVKGCKGKAKIKDVDGDDTQDKAVWLFECKEAAMASFLLTIEGDEAATAMTAAQEVMAGATRKGLIQVVGSDNDGPSLTSALMQELDEI